MQLTVLFRGLLVDGRTVYVAGRGDWVRCEGCCLDVGGSSGRIPETHILFSAPDTFATKAAAGRWLDANRTNLDRGNAVDDQSPNQPLREWWLGCQCSWQSLKP